MKKKKKHKLKKPKHFLKLNNLPMKWLDKGIKITSTDGIKRKYEIIGLSILDKENPRLALSNKKNNKTILADAPFLQRIRDKQNITFFKDNGTMKEKKRYKSAFGSLKNYEFKMHRSGPNNPHHCITITGKKK